MAKSFTDELIHNADYYAKRVFDRNPNIKNYKSFSDEFYKYFGTPRGQNAKIDEEDIKIVWASDYTKRKIGKENYEKELTQEEYLQPKAVLIPTIKIKKTKDRKGYTKQINREWRTSQINFLKLRKSKKQSLAKITKDYNDTFPLEERRTKKAIKSKLQRL